MSLRHTVVVIRKAGFDDAKEFLRLEASCFEMEFSPNTLYYWRPIIDYCWAFKAVQGQRIVGGIIAMPTRDGRIYVNSLFVHPRLRKCGIGTALLSRILGLKGRGAFVLDVWKDEPSLHRFYKRYGFRKASVKKNYYMDRSTRIIMVKQQASH